MLPGKWPDGTTNEECIKLNTRNNMQDKRFGYFDDDNREYVITDPKTPWPWINYLGNEDFFSLISNTAGGYSFYKDAKFRRITRYRYNNVPMDNGDGIYLILKSPSAEYFLRLRPVQEI